MHEQDSIKSRACADEVFYFEKMEVSDFRNDVLLAEACRADVDKFCKHVEPGALLILPLLLCLSVSTQTATPFVCKHVEPDACLIFPPSGFLDLTGHSNCLCPWAAARLCTHSAECLCGCSGPQWMEACQLSVTAGLD